jgi:hypothetical protein
MQGVQPTCQRVYAMNFSGLSAHFHWTVFSYFKREPSIQTVKGTIAWPCRSYWAYKRLCSGAGTSLLSKCDLSTYCCVRLDSCPARLISGSTMVVILTTGLFTRILSTCLGPNRVTSGLGRRSCGGISMCKVLCQ